MSEDAECNMGSRVRETWMSRPWVGKGEWGEAKTDKIFCLSWLSHTPKCGKCVKVWMKAQQRATTPAKRPSCEPLPKRQLWRVSCPVLSHTQAANPSRSQHTALWDLGQDTPLPAPSALGEAWIRNLKHLWLWHFVQQNKNKTCPSSFFKVSAPFNIWGKNPPLGLNLYHLPSPAFSTARSTCWN